MSHKKGFWNGFIDNSINSFINISETHFVHINSSSRIFWSACQLLVVAWMLKLLKLETLSSIFVCYSNISQTKLSKSQIRNKQRQWHRNMICSDMVWYILTGVTGTALIVFRISFITASITVAALICDELLMQLYNILHEHLHNSIKSFMKSLTTPYGVLLKSAKWVSFHAFGCHWV